MDQPDAEALVLRLNEEWNDAYRHHDRTPLRHILAEDFIGLTPTGDEITKASLMVNPSEAARSVTFSEEFVRIFGAAAIARGRLHLEFDDRRIDQRFVRIFSHREGRWQAVSVAITPILPQSPDPQRQRRD